jgi:hypothetical protein
VKIRSENKKAGWLRSHPAKTSPLSAGYDRPARLWVFFDFNCIRFIFIDSILTPFTSPSTGLDAATFAFLAVFKVLIKDFFSMDMSAFPPSQFLNFLSYLQTRPIYAPPVPNSADLAKNRQENSPDVKSITYSRPSHRALPL